MRQTLHLGILALATLPAARADFSLIETVRQGSSTSTTTRSYQGQKLRIESANSVTLLNLANHSVTVLNPLRKTYAVRTVGSASDLLKQAAGINAKTNLRETGAHKTIAGYEARQLMFTMDVPTTAQGAQVTVRMEAEIWLANVPGSAEMTAFQKAGGNQLLGSGAGASGLQKSLTDLEHTIEQMGGVPVLQIVRIRMGNAAPLVEITTEMSQFSTKAVPASRFAVPPGYQLLKPKSAPSKTPSK